MPIFQVQYKYNRVTSNLDLEAKNKDSVLQFFDKLTVVDVSEVKRIIFNDETVKDKRIAGLRRYASVKVFIENKIPFTIKIPNLKTTKDEKDINNLLKELYPNIQKLSINIVSTK